MKTRIITLSLALAVAGAAHAATITWTNLAGGNWSVAANWNPNQVPSSSDDAFVTNNGSYTVTLDNDVTLNSLTFGATTGQQTLTNNANTLTLNNASSFNTNSVFGIGGGRLDGIAAFNGQCVWTGGVIGSGGGAVNFGTNATLLFSGQDGADYPLVGNVTNAGTINLQSGNLQVYEATLVNLPGAIINVQTNVSIDSFYAGPIINEGTVNVFGGTNTTTISPVFENTGTLAIESGTVNLASGGSDSGVIQQKAAGTAILFSSGEFTLNGNLACSNAILAGAQLDGNGIISGSLTWTNGVLGNGGYALTLATNSTLLLNGQSGINYPLVGNVTNAGTINLQSGNLQAYEATLVNLPGAVINVQANVSIDAYFAGPMVNEGMVNVFAGGGTATISPAFENTGTLAVESGTVNLAGGGSDSGVIQQTAAGTAILFSSGEFTLNGNLACSNAILAGSALDGTGVISGLLTWTNGSLGSDGNALTLATNSTLILNGTVGTDYVLMDGSFTNAGTIRLQSGNLQLRRDNLDFANTLVNLPGAIINVQTNVSIDSFYGGTIANEGTVNAFGGTNTISPEFDNSGLLNVQSGTVSLAGNYNLTGGTVNFGISSPTNFGSLNFAGSANLAGNLSVNLNGGYIPNDTNAFVVLTYGSVSSVFTSTNLPFTDAWQVGYGATNTTLQVLNARPFLTTTTNQTINELTLLTATFTASDIDVPAQTLTFGLVSAPNGMTINPVTGVIHWTPAQTESPSTNTILVSVTDNGNPALSATNSFTVIVREVNTVPVLPIIAATNVNELTLLTVTNTAAESNIHSVTTGYTLVNPPAGMSISTNGIITWTPSQTQSPSTNIVTTIVANSNPYALTNPVLTATNSFIVVVKEVNVAPVLPVIAATNINELTMLTVTNTASESNIHSTITGYGLVNPPSGMNISASGVITWTPSQNQSPSTNIITTIVTNNNAYDTLNPQLTSTNRFTVIVKEINVAPVLPLIVPQTVDELSLLTVTNTATDANIHSVVGYALVNPPSGMSISTNGVITWTPAQTQSPATNTITAIAVSTNNFDAVNPQLSVTNSFTVIVREVNMQPVLPIIADTSINELTTLTVTNTATEPNIHSVTAEYALLNPPAGMEISTNGVITWTPSQNQSPSTNVITTMVMNYNPYDPENAGLSADNTFIVIVREVNVAPVLPVITATNINELATLTVTNTASESNIHATITGYALVNPPAGMSISTNGVISWTPAQTQSPSTNVITTVVTNSDPLDVVNPMLTSTNSFTVVVNEVNVAPVLPVIAATNINELTTLTVTNTASESNIHSVTTGYALVNPPAGVSISTNGVITWTPAQTQSPSTNVIITIATNTNAFDLENPTLTATNSFTVIVNEVNVAPVLPVIGTQNVNVFQALTVTNTASDSNIHATLAYSLVNPPAGMNISANGVITWTPNGSQAPATNIITTVATATDGFDSVHPVLSVTNNFTVIVHPVTMISGAAWLGNGQFRFSFNTVDGQDYTIEYSTNLVHWTPLLELQGDGGTFNIVDPNANNTQGFYRIASP